MHRRALLFGMAGAAAWPRAVSAQAKPDMPVIGFLSTGSVDAAGLLATFKEAMRSRGYVDGQNVRIAFRVADAAPESLSRLSGGGRAAQGDAIRATVTPS